MRKKEEKMEVKETEKVFHFSSEGFSDSVQEKVRSLQTQAHVVYAFYALSFLIPILSIVGVIIAYVSQGKARELGNAPLYLLDTFKWQIKTFWVSLILTILSIGLALLFLFPLVALTVLADTIWWIFRLVYGWIKLGWKERLYKDGENSVFW